MFCGVLRPHLDVFHRRLTGWYYMEKRRKYTGAVICAILTVLIFLQILFLLTPNTLMHLRVQIEAGRMWLIIMREYFTSEVLLYVC